MNLPFNKDGYYAQGRLASLRVVYNTRTTDSILVKLILVLVDDPASVPGPDGTEDGDAKSQIPLYGFIPKTPQGRKLYQSLRNPLDSSDTSCNQDAFVLVHFNMVSLADSFPGMPERLALLDFIELAGDRESRRVRPGQGTTL